MKISVILTTYNNEDIIEESLLSYCNQSLSHDRYEIIVVDDGSTDKTASVIDRIAKNNHEIKVIHQENSGVSRARNVGAKHALSEILFFTQGDIVAQNTVLKIHYDFHTEHAEDIFALVGHISWHPRLKITPFMIWLEHGGPQFDFDRLLSDTEADYLSFYTPHVSLKTKFFNTARGFDETFVVRPGITAYEDTELAWRLCKMGMKLYYDKKAVVFHYHAKTLDGVLRRRYFEGKMSRKLHKKHPGFSFAGSLRNRKFQTIKLSDKHTTLLTSLFLNEITIKPLESLARFIETRFSFPLLFKLVCRYHYNRGMKA